MAGCLDASYREFLPGYAFTSYGSQARDCGLCFIFRHDYQVPQPTPQQWYVTISRGGAASAFFTPDKEQLRENIRRFRFTDRYQPLPSRESWWAMWDSTLSKHFVCIREQHKHRINIRQNATSRALVKSAFTTFLRKLYCQELSGKF